MSEDKEQGPERQRKPPCPFCGSRKIQRIDGDDYCNGCGARGPNERESKFSWPDRADLAQRPVVDPRQQQCHVSVTGKHTVHGPHCTACGTEFPLAQPVGELTVEQFVTDRKQHIKLAAEEIEDHLLKNGAISHRAYLTDVNTSDLVDIITRNLLRRVAEGKDQNGANM